MILYQAWQYSNKNYSEVLVGFQQSCIQQDILSKLGVAASHVLVSSQQVKMVRSITISMSEKAEVINQVQSLVTYDHCITIQDIGQAWN